MRSADGFLEQRRKGRLLLPVQQRCAPSGLQHHTAMEGGACRTGLVASNRPNTPPRTCRTAEPRSGPTAQDYEKRIEDLRHKKRRGLDRLLERDDPDTELLVEGLRREIADLEKRRDASAKAERSKPDLPATVSAFAAVAAFAQEMEKSDGKERARLRRMIMQQLRAAFSELRFSEHRIDGLIPLPGKPPMKTPIGLPCQIEVKIEDHDFEKLERYYLRHMIFSDDPDHMASLAEAGSPAPKRLFNSRYTDGT